MIKQSDEIDKLAAALAKAQGAIPAAAKSGYNPHFKAKFATFEDIRAAIQKPFADNGLSYSQLPEFGEDGFVLWTYLFHESGQYIACDFPLNPGNASNPMQAAGSAMAYARRYTLGSISGASAENDDDAENAVDVKPAKKRQPKPKWDKLEDFLHDLYKEFGEGEKDAKARLKKLGYTGWPTNGNAAAKQKQMYDDYKQDVEFDQTVDEPPLFPDEMQESDPSYKEDSQ